MSRVAILYDLKYSVFNNKKKYEVSEETSVAHTEA